MTQPDPGIGRPSVEPVRPGAVEQSMLSPQPAAVPAGHNLPATAWDGLPPGQQSVPEPSPVVERPHPLTPFVRAWVLVVAAVWGLGREMISNNDDFRLPPLNWLTGLGGVVLIALLIIAYLDWRATSFVMDARELRMESGVFVKTSERIRYNRIQAVDVSQPLLPRLLGMAELTIDVGSEGGQRIRYLSRKRAAAMREYLLARAHGLPAERQQESNARVMTDLTDDDQVLVRVPPGRLVLGAVLSHELLLMAIPVLVGLSIAAWRHPEGWAGLFGAGWPIFGVALPALFAFWGFVVRRVLGQWNYAFVRSGPGVKITRGLTNLTSQSVPRHRIQSLRIVQPLWWRRLGWHRVEMTVLGNSGGGSEDEGATTSNVLLPIGTAEDVALVLADIWPGLRLDDIELHRSPARVRWTMPLAYSWAGWGYDSEVLLLQTGWLTRVQVVLPHARLQSLALSQGPLARRLNVASLAFHTTNVQFAARADNLDPAVARELMVTEVARAKSAGLRALLVDSPAGPEPGTRPPPYHPTLP